MRHFVHIVFPCFALWLGVALAGCSDEPRNADGDTGVCEPGATQACECEATVRGASSCADSGERWLPCVCAPRPDAGPNLDSGGEAAPQNVLLVISDDLGVDASMCYGHDDSVAPTPTIRSLCDKGVVFNNAWANPLCSPTRASILTGRYGFRTGIGAVVSANADGIRSDEFTLPRALDVHPTRSYSHANIGKWHLAGNNNGGDDNPKLMGYSHFSGSISGVLRPGYREWDKTVNGETETITRYATTETVDDAIAWFDEQSGPWFMWLAFNAPHDPFHLPPSDLHSQQALSGEERDIRQNPGPYYKAMIEALDSELDRLLTHMGPETLARTHIIYIGDNGTPANAGNPRTQGGQAKGSLYQGGIHVPLVISGPAISSPGRTVDALVNGVDLFATILEMTGMNVSAAVPAHIPLDTVSLLPYLSDPDTPSRRDWIFSELFGTNIRDDAGKTVRNTRFKLIRFDNGSEAFYDLLEDPEEQEDLLRGAALSDAELRSYTRLGETLDGLLASD